MYNVILERKEMQPQITIQKEVILSGVGLHRGNIVNMRLIPAEANSGIVFKRIDIEDDIKNIVQAKYNNVGDTKLCTMLVNEYGVSVGTIEHLMSALAICNIDNLIIELDSNEVPILDGSSIKYIEAIDSVGLKELAVAKKSLVIKSPITLKTKDWEVSFVPSDKFELDVTIDFGDNIIGRQQVKFTPSEGNYAKDIAKARTFCLERDIQYLQSKGLALGGSLDNAIVVGESGVLNPQGLRYSDEFVRHKVLDAIGDLYLSGYNIKGKFIGYKCGHTSNNEILRELFENKDAYTIEDSNIYYQKEDSFNDANLSKN